MAESLEQITGGENFTGSEQIKPVAENTLNFLENLTKRRVS